MTMSIQDDKVDWRYVA